MINSDPMFMDRDIVEAALRIAEHPGNLSALFDNIVCNRAGTQPSVVGTA
jgi:hypothetical protein